MKVGAIPLYRSPGGLRVCLVSTSGSRRRFTVPKGVPRRRERWEVGALRELREEAGVSGRILLPRHPLVLAGTRRPSDSIVLYWCEIESVDDTWAEDGFRRRVFCPVDQLPKVRLGGVGRKVFGEILELDLGAGQRPGSGRMGIAERIRAKLSGLAVRADIDAVTGS